MWNFLGGVFSPSKSTFTDVNMEWLYPIAKFLDDILIPLIIIVLAAGAIWIIILGTKLARAEDTTKAEEAKKRLINVAISIVAVIVFIFLLAFVSTNISTWLSSDSQPFTTAIT